MALEAIEEYRRFCFLAVVAGHAVTPSEEVDAVWHLHLLHTWDYWEVFCPKVLGKRFHHGPTEGGAQEESRFYDQYAATLGSYQHWFGPPPRGFLACRSLALPSFHPVALGSLAQRVDHPQAI